MSSSRNKSLRMSPVTSSSSSRRSPSTFASSTATNFTSSAALLPRASSPTRLNIMRFSMNDNYHRSVSPNRSISIKRQTANNNAVSFNNTKKRTCACSPTNHPGSFRCAFHKKNGNSETTTSTTSYQHSSSSLNCRRSAMTNSLVRIGGVEGELVKRALSALIRPSSHQLRRRAAFERRPSRLSVMSTS